MKHYGFSCYVDSERFLSEPVKELTDFLCCMRRGKRIETILAVANFLKDVDKLHEFFEFKKSPQKEKLFLSLPLDEKEKTILWKLIQKFFLKHSENASGKPIPQNDLIALRKGRLFEEIIFRVGPVKNWKVELISMHCQPLINGKKLNIYCNGKPLTGKNLDVVFWGKNYIEGYECKSNVPVFIELGKGNSRKAKKIREKVIYLNQLAKTLKKFFKEINITLASFAPVKPTKEQINLIKSWIYKCDKDEKLYFKISTVEEILKEVE